MENVFTKTSVNEISARIKDALSTIGREFGIELILDGGVFDSDTMSLEIRGKINPDAEGSPEPSVPTHIRTLAEMAVDGAGLHVRGSIIGSVWKVRGKIYSVAEYVPKRRKYPFTILSGRKRMKCSVDFFKEGVQLVAPTEEEFAIWLNVDPDSDAVRESDVEVADRVQEYFSSIYPYEETFFHNAGIIAENGGVNGEVSSLLYKILMRDGVSAVTGNLWKIIEKNGWYEK